MVNVFCQFIVEYILPISSPTYIQLQSIHSLALTYMSLETVSINLASLINLGSFFHT